MAPYGDMIPIASLPQAVQEAAGLVSQKPLSSATQPHQPYEPMPAHANFVFVPVHVPIETGKAPVWTGQAMNQAMQTPAPALTISKSIPICGICSFKPELTNALCQAGFLMGEASQGMHKLFVLSMNRGAVQFSQSLQITVHSLVAMIDGVACRICDAAGVALQAIESQGFQHQMQDHIDYRSFLFHLDEAKRKTIRQNVEYSIKQLMRSGVLQTDREYHLATAQHLVPVSDENVKEVQDGMKKINEHPQYTVKQGDEWKFSNKRPF